MPVFSNKTQVFAQEGRLSHYMEHLFTLKEVAELLRLSPQTVYKMIREGMLTAVQVGSQWRFEKDKIEAWLTAHSSQKTDPSEESHSSV